MEEVEAVFGDFAGGLGRLEGGGWLGCFLGWGAPMGQDPVVVVVVVDLVLVGVHMLQIPLLMCSEQYQRKHLLQRYLGKMKQIVHSHGWEQ